MHSANSFTGPVHGILEFRSVNRVTGSYLLINNFGWMILSFFLLRSLGAYWRAAKLQPTSNRNRKGEEWLGRIGLRTRQPARALQESASASAELHPCPSRSPSSSLIGRPAGL